MLSRSSASNTASKELARTLVASGLRIKAKYRVKSVTIVLELRWKALFPEQPELGASLLARWNEPHRNYHSATHLLAVLEALDQLSNRAAPRAVVLAAWFHDAVYNGTVSDEEDSAVLAQACLNGFVEPTEVLEVARLVRLTATHSPTATDSAGHLLCDADLAILGAESGEYSRYLVGVRRDFAHVSDDDFTKGRVAVVRQLLALDPMFHTARGRELWGLKAQENLGKELARLS